MTDKRIEICENGGDPKNKFPSRTISKWGSNQFSANDVVGFEPGRDKVKILQLFVGYSQEQIDSPSFQKQLQQDEKIFHDQVGSKLFDFGHVNKNINIGIIQQQRSVTPSLNPLALPEMIQLWHEINKAYPNTDAVIIRPNPALANPSELTKPLAFGTAFPHAATAFAAGPNMNDNYRYENLYSASVMTHEFAHVLSDFTKRDIFYRAEVNMADSYSYGELNYDRLASGRHSELTLAPNLENLRKYYPDGLSPTMAKAIEAIKPVITDTRFQCTETSLFGKDKVHRVYSFNSGPDLMEKNFTNGELQSGTQAVTPLQRYLFDTIARDYLQREGRLPQSPAPVAQPEVTGPSNAPNILPPNTSRKL